MQNPMVAFTFFVLDQKHHFWANFVQKIKIVGEKLKFDSYNTSHKFWDQAPSPND